ncbi:MAG: inositol-3-phosphate synthase [Candidatus Levyibacteriota bacterium]
MKDKIKIAIVGVGNCASSLVQGLTYYGDGKTAGLMHVDIGGYHVSDITVVAAFDVNKTKVGKDVAEAICAKPNNTTIFAEVSAMGVEVKNAPVMDGIGQYTKDIIFPSTEKQEDPVTILKSSGAEILINYLPVGSQEATEYLANICLEAGIAMINCIPVFIASNKDWAQKFTEKNIPIIGDDIKSQVGATILHRTLVNLFLDRGLTIDKTYQLNVGGNMDFQNMLERERLASKKKSKTQSVTSQFDRKNIHVPQENVYIGPSDYVSWLKDNKVAFIRMEGKEFGDVPMNVEVRLSVEDSPNSAGIVIDAIRLAKVALNKKIGGVLTEASAYLMKSPPVQYTDEEAKEKVEAFISANA